MSHLHQMRADDPDSVLRAVSRAAAGHVVRLVDSDGAPVVDVLPAVGHESAVHSRQRADLFGAVGVAGESAQALQWRRASAAEDYRQGDRASSAPSSDVAEEWRAEGSMPTLWKVIVLRGRIVRLPWGSSLSLISLELWSSMLMLRGAYPRVAGSPLLSRLAWTCSDDVGRVFVPRGGAATGTGGMLIEHWAFTPAPDDTATVFRFELAGHSEGVTVDIANTVD